MFWMNSRRALRAICLAAACLAGPAAAQTDARVATGVGPVTNLPMPRFVSLKVSEANVRRGPSLTHRIDWVFQRRGMPLVVTAEYGHWRRVADRDGQGGWVHYTMLTGVRSVLVEADMLSLRTRPDADAPERAVLERGVVARLETCEAAWCELDAQGYSGWAPQEALWGATLDDVGQ